MQYQQRIIKMLYIIDFLLQLSVAAQQNCRLFFFMLLSYHWVNIYIFYVILVNLTVRGVRGQAQEGRHCVNNPGERSREKAVQEVIQHEVNTRKSWTHSNEGNRLIGCR